MFYFSETGETMKLTFFKSNGLFFRSCNLLSLSQALSYSVVLIFQCFIKQVQATYCVDFLNSNKTETLQKMPIMKVFYCSFRIRYSKKIENQVRNESSLYNKKAGSILRQICWIVFLDVISRFYSLNLITLFKSEEKLTRHIFKSISHIKDLIIKTF